MTKDEVLEDLAQILVGLGVPGTVGGARVLGEAYEPWRQLKRQVSARAGTSWPTQEQYEAFLSEILNLKEEGS